MVNSAPAGHFDALLVDEERLACAASAGPNWPCGTSRKRLTAKLRDAPAPIAGSGTKASEAASPRRAAAPGIWATGRTIGPGGQPSDWAVGQVQEDRPVRP